MAPYDSNLVLDAPAPGQVAAESMTTIETRFGTFEVDPAWAIEMPQGPFGFGDHRRFVLLELPGDAANGLRLFQSLDDANVSFLVLPLANENELIQPDDVKAACDAYCFDPANSAVLFIVTLRRDVAGNVEATANLKAPILVDGQNQIARQVVFTNPDYPIRAPLGN